MTPKVPVNVAASVRQRLLNRARTEHEDFQYLLTRFALERLLFRLSASRHAPTFVLKGAMLFSVWTNVRHRVTRDVDLRGSGPPDLDRLEAIFRELCTLQVPDDGIVLRPETIRAFRIREDQEYEGVRVTLVATLERARLDLQVDVGFGDAITPSPQETALPTLLDFPAPVLRTYPRETVVAEKLHAMVDLGMANSRMKDFFDLLFLAQHFDFEGRLLVSATRATFERRRTALPNDIPPALSPVFFTDAGKQTQWRAFLRRTGLVSSGGDLSEVVERLAVFLLPVLEAAKLPGSWEARWAAGDRWHELR